MLCRQYSPGWLVWQSSTLMMIFQPGIGRRCTDLLVLWPATDAEQRIVLELKLLHKSLQQTLQTGLEQTWQYMDRCAAEQGHLIIFDRSTDKSWDDKIFQRSEQIHNKNINVWGM